MSTLKVNAIQNTSGVEQYLAKAWVNFNGQGTVAIRASGNVSSVSDLGGGHFQVNFATALSDSSYSPVVSASTIGGGTSFIVINSNISNTARTAPTTSAFTILTVANGAVYDPADVCVSVFR